MSTQSLETEFNKYWSILNTVEKASLLTVAKNYVHLKQESVTSLEDYNKEIDEAVLRVEAGEFYTQEEVVKMAKEW